MRTLKIISLIITVIGIIVLNIAMFSWVLNLPETAYLWHNGPVQGWIEFGFIDGLITLLISSLGYMALIEEA